MVNLIKDLHTEEAFLHYLKMMTKTRYDYDLSIDSCWFQLHFHGFVQFHLMKVYQPEIFIDIQSRFSLLLKTFYK